MAISLCKDFKEFNFMKWPNYFIAFICLLFITLTVNADTIKLKNGTVVKGKVISFASGSFTVALDLGTSSQSKVILDTRDVETIEFDGRGDDTSNVSSVRENNIPRPSAPDDDTGHRANNAPSRPTPVVTKPITNNSPTTTSTAVKEIATQVTAKDDWSYANLTVRRGDRIRLTASGKVKLSSSRESGPEGIELEDKNKLILDKPTGSLIAVIGDDNDDFIHIGREGEFVAKRDGKLFLSVNEGDLSDNSGQFSVQVRIEPAR